MFSSYFTFPSVFFIWMFVLDLYLSIDRSISRYEIMLSTRPEKSVGTDEIWELATEGLKGALKRKGWDYTVRSYLGIGSQ